MENGVEPDRSPASPTRSTETCFREKPGDIKDKEFDSPEAHKEAFHGLMQEYKTSIGQILTEEQKAMLIPKPSGGKAAMSE